jgi:hypothetical protein
MMSRRVNLTIPDEVEDLFNWTVKYDPSFKGKEATAAAHFLALGIKAAYEESLRSPDPLDADEFSSISKHARKTLKKA